MFLCPCISCKMIVGSRLVDFCLTFSQDCSIDGGDLCMPVMLLHYDGHYLGHSEYYKTYLNAMIVELPFPVICS